MERTGALTVEAASRHAREDATIKAIAVALGAELRRAREAKGLSRAQFIRLLPSGIGERTLLAYEHGLRQLTIVRFAELCDALGATPSVLLTEALQRARINLTSMALRVDLRALANNNRIKFQPLIGWAKNKLSECPSGIAEVAPSVVAEFATLMGYTRVEVAEYLATFLPEPDEPDANAMDHSRKMPRR